MYEQQLNQVNALFSQKEQELKQAGMQRQRHLEHILKDCQAQLHSKTVKLTQLERAHSLLQSESGDQKGLLEQYESRFVQVKQHIEASNHEHANQVEALTKANDELKKQVYKVTTQLKQSDDDKINVQQKLRDLEWAKDQEAKALEKTLAREREDQEAYKISSFQDIERIKEEVSQRFKAELQHKS